MYKILSTISYIIRFWLAYITIEKVSIFKSEIINYFWGEVISVYTILILYINLLYYVRQNFHRGWK